MSQRKRDKYSWLVEQGGRKRKKETRAWEKWKREHESRRWECLFTSLRQNALKGIVKECKIQECHFYCLQNIDSAPDLIWLWTKFISYLAEVCYKTLYDFDDTQCLVNLLSPIMQKEPIPPFLHPYNPHYIQQTNLPNLHLARFARNTLDKSPHVF